MPVVRCNCCSVSLDVQSCGAWVLFACTANGAGKQNDVVARKTLVRMKKRTSNSPGHQKPGFPIAAQIDGGPRSSENSAIPIEERSVAFGLFQLEPDGTLLRGKKVVHLPPKELAALRLLLAHAGQIVPPEQIRQALWGEVHVSAESVPRCLSSLRARLEPENCIQTIYKRGYRFSANVQRESGAPQVLPARLVVLPFVPGPNVPAHLGAAIAEETIIRLIGAQPAVASVLARDSAFTLASEGLTSLQIGEMLKADLVLTGTIRALPSQFRLRAEMIRVKDWSQIWVEDLLIPRERSAGLETELAERLFLRLCHEVPRCSRGEGSASVNISAAEFQETASEPDRRDAYGLYQAAHFEWQSLRRHQMQNSMQRMFRAIELDPSLLAARVDLAQLCVAQSVYGFVSPAVAADCVHRTVESIPNFPDRAEAILPSLGTVCLHADRDMAAAISAFSRSAHLPHDPWITFARTMFSLSRHRFEEAVGILEAALDEDPYAPWLHARLAWALHLAGQHRESVERIHYGIKTFPGHEGAAIYGAVILPFNGDAEGGVQLGETLSAREPYFDFVLALQGYALACAGRKDEARACLERLQWLSRERFVSPSFNAAVHVAMGDNQAALKELHASSEVRCPWFFQMLADPRLKPLHGDPEFQEMRATLACMESAANRRPLLHEARDAGGEHVQMDGYL
jgi:DNA-binding winged helix-turn-helix (wHTH) protein/tetratricopeptide (TPR) repeat protein